MRQKGPLMIFLLLWTTYFMCYCLRKPLSIYKYYIESEFHLSQSDLGWIDVSLLLPYAMVQIFGAGLLDSFRFVHSYFDFSSLYKCSSSAISNFSFGLAEGSLHKK